MVGQKLRIAFSHIPSGQWTAGLHYLKNLFVALRSLDVTVQPEIILLVEGNSSPDSYLVLQKYIDQVIYFPPVPPEPNFWQRQQIRVQKRLGLWRPKEHFLSVYLRQHKIDLLFGLNNSLGSNFCLPILTWIPDFQHKHLPEMFSEMEINSRNSHFQIVADKATRIILSSEDARRDFNQFAPEFMDKARILSFVAQIPESIYDDFEQVWTIYHLPNRFIFLPNQFWRHKNHYVVAEAVAIAKIKCPDITVVCTGNTNEYRWPTYFGTLLSKISLLDIRQNLILLGFIPHMHLFQLMRQSLVVLQPSLFEGWSTTVEEVKSVGKKMILSDIPVHREQNPPKAKFFDPHNAQALADLLCAIYQSETPGPDLALEREARAKLPSRTNQFGQTFLDIAQDAVAFANFGRNKNHQI